MKVARTVWSGGKDGDNIKILPITIIRELAIEMLKQLKIAAPILFKNIGPKCVQGPCPEGNMTCGKIVKIREKFKNL